MILLHSLPIIVVLILIAVFKKPPVSAALFGALSALVLWGLNVADPFSIQVAHTVLSDTAILFLTVAFIMATGLILVILLDKTPTNHAFNEWINTLNLPEYRKLLLIVLGIAPLLESMTGFGVSLIASLPILLSFLPRQIALKIAITTLAIMPLGMVGLASIIGSSLVDIPTAALASMSALISSPVLIFLTGLALYYAGLLNLKSLCSVIGFGTLFATVLYVTCVWIGVEVAGIFAGLSVILACFMGRKVHIPKQTWAYGLLFIAILLLKVIGFFFDLYAIIKIEGANTQFEPMKSPGLAILLVAFFVWWANRSQYTFHQLYTEWLKRASRPLITIFCFLLMSQIMVQGGFLASFRQLLNDLPSHFYAPLFTLLGTIGGYLTGSTLGGNILIMPSLPSPDATLGAIINSSAGHAALGSLPMIALIASLAKATKEEEQNLARFALMIIAMNTVLVAIMGTFIYSLDDSVITSG